MGQQQRNAHTTSYIMLPFGNGGRDPLSKFPASVFVGAFFRPFLRYPRKKRPAQVSHGIEAWSHVGQTCLITASITKPHANIMNLLTVMPMYPQTIKPLSTV